MSAELFVKFLDPSWYADNVTRVRDSLRQLATFESEQADVTRLRGTESAPGGLRCGYDVRVFFGGDHRRPILLEISARPKSVQEDLIRWFRWLRSATAIVVVDEDEEITGW
jgi:hypothetical protein